MSKKVTTKSDGPMWDDQLVFRYSALLLTLAAWLMLIIMRDADRALFLAMLAVLPLVGSIVTRR